MSVQSRNVGDIAKVAAAASMLAFLLVRSQRQKERTRLQSTTVESTLPTRTNASILKMWEGFSEGYENYFRLWSLPAHYSMISALDLQHATACLEIGCGPGHGLAALQRELPSGVRLCGCDFSPKMVALAALNTSRVEVTVADVQALPDHFSGAFDRVVASLCYHIVPDYVAALREMRRVCAPGGRIALSVWGQKCDSPMFTLFPAVLEEFRRTGRLPPDQTPPMRTNFHLGADDALLRQHVTNVGFTDVLSWHVPCVWGQQKGIDYARDFTGSQPACRAALEQMPVELREQVVARLAEKADEVLAPGKPIACDVVVVVANAPL